MKPFDCSSLLLHTVCAMGYCLCLPKVKDYCLLNLMDHLHLERQYYTKTTTALDATITGSMKTVELVRSMMPRERYQIHLFSCLHFHMSTCVRES